MRYFVTYMPYTDEIHSVYKIIGETEKYYRLQALSKYAIICLVRKKDLYERGGSTKFYELPEEEIERLMLRRSALYLISKTDFCKLTDSQLSRIKTILEENHGKEKD